MRQFAFVLITALFSLMIASSLSASEDRHIVTIAGTADLQGMMEPVMQKVDLEFDGNETEMSLGGMARIATVIKELKAKDPTMLFVSTGDDLMNRYFHTFKGRAIMSLISDAGYDLYAFGNHEFDKGSDVLAEALKGTSFEVLCSDLNVSHSALKGACEPYVIKNMDGVRVGFFSLITEDLPLVTSERDVTLLTDNVTTAEKMVKSLREVGADVIVALSHIGYKRDVHLAKQVKGIDLIFGGHSHSYVKKIGHVNDTAIVNGGRYDQ